MSHYAVPAAVIAVAFVLLLGLVYMMRGGPANRSQRLMRLRVLLQFVAIVATIWAMGRSFRPLGAALLRRRCLRIVSLFGLRWR
jgi:Hypoxia induced protein conserved region